MDTPSPRPNAPAPADRARTVEALCRHFAEDHIDDVELERRLDAAHRADSRATLAELTTDLPPLASRDAPAYELAPADHVSERGVAIAVMGGAERKGNWTPPRKLAVIAVMGGADIDLREARFPEGVTEIMAVAFWGAVEIIVPPWVRVESNGIAIMGGFEHGRGESAAGPESPTLRIGGVALMGAVEINTRFPGESARDAARRRKLARKAEGAYRLSSE